MVACLEFGGEVRGFTDEREEECLSMLQKAFGSMAVKIEMLANFEEMYSGTPRMSSNAGDVLLKEFLEESEEKMNGGKPAKAAKKTTTKKLAKAVDLGEEEVIGFI